MNQSLKNLVGYLWQVFQIMGVAFAIATLVLLAVKLWGDFGLLP